MVGAWQYTLGQAAHGCPAEGACCGYCANSWRINTRSSNQRPLSMLQRKLVEERHQAC